MRKIVTLLCFNRLVIWCAWYYGELGNMVSFENEPHSERA
jgi:hypothetical protein